MKKWNIAIGIHFTQRRKSETLTAKLYHGRSDVKLHSTVKILYLEVQYVDSFEDILCNLGTDAREIA